MKVFDDKIIFLISNESWDPIWYSKHHYASELSKNNLVYFVEPPLKYSEKKAYKGNLLIRQISDSLFVIKYRNFIPGSGRGMFFDWLNDVMISRKIVRELKLGTSSKSIIVWNFDPFRYYGFSKVGAQCIILQLVDLYPRRYIKLASRHSDFYVTVSDQLKKEISFVANPVLRVQHSISSVSAVSDINLEPCKSILLIGTLTNRVDYEVLLKLSRHLPDVMINIAGPVIIDSFSDDDVICLELLKSCENVNFLGSLNQSLLAKEIEKSYLCIALYKESDVTAGLNSLKILHYLSAGKKVVCSYLSDCNGLLELGLIDMVRGNKNFVEACKHQLESIYTRQEISNRINYVKKFTYVKTIQLIDQHIGVNLSE